jgi:uncharacterized FlaG/YvyC family protein
MNLTSVGIAPQLSSEPSAQNSSALPDQTRQLAQSVQRLNDSSLVPDGREFALSLDPKTKLPVVRVLDTTTHDVIEQVPAEYILSLTASLESEQSQQNDAQHSAY